VDKKVDNDKKTQCGHQFDKCEQSNVTTKEKEKEELKENEDDSKRYQIWQLQPFLLNLLQERRT
jgi:hypothetical protein